MSAISIVVLNAVTAEQKELCYRIRYDVFVKETGYLQRENTSGLEKDSYDELETTFHYLAYFNGAPAGTVRLIFPNNATAKKENSIYGLPMEHIYDINYYTTTDLKIGEISRACVKEKYKSTKTILYLWRELIRFSIQKGITDLVANVNPETDSLSDTYLIYRYIKSKNLVDKNIVVYPKKVGGKTSRVRFPLRECANANLHKTDDILLPQTLKLFVRVGLIFTGEPVYCEGIDMCALPMNWKLKDIYKTPFGKFFSKKETGTGEEAA